MPRPRRNPRMKHQSWQGPVPGSLGGWVPWRIVLGRSSEALVVLRDFEAYPEGLHFSMVTRSPPGHPVDLMTMGRTDHWPHLGVTFADQRSTTLGDLPEVFHRKKAPNGPLLWPGGGGGSPDQWRSDFWLWPLPPPGPLTWVSSWEQRGLPETSVTVDASVLVDAAREAEQLWEFDASPGWSSIGPIVLRRTSPDEGDEGDEGDD